MLSAARIDLAAFFVHLVAANVFGALHATCNRVETVARRRWRVSQEVFSRVNCLDPAGEAKRWA